uniref:VWFA domain-containing protein n=1 Tax=Biomphalaria glabrata TaxID=6526 RepID=A0A2C9KN34_BIOGL
MVSGSCHARHIPRAAHPHHQTPFEVEAIGYSANRSIHILPHWTEPSKASKKLWKLKQFPNTDAWSSSAFTNIQFRPKYVNNILFYVTSQTTNNDTNRDQTLKDVNRVKAMGWNVRVFALKTSSSVIDLNELADIDKSFITISDEPKRYTGLSREVTKILKSACKEFNNETLIPCKTKGRKSRAHQD